MANGGMIANNDWQESGNWHDVLYGATNGPCVNACFLSLPKLQFTYTYCTIFCINVSMWLLIWKYVSPILEQWWHFLHKGIILLVHSMLDNFNRIWWNFYYSALSNKGDSWWRTEWPFCDQSFGYTTDERGSITSKNEAVDPHWYKTGCRRSQLLLSSGMGEKDKNWIPSHIRS